jgi:Kef-type K+ transport system membrane component KefB
MKISNMVPTAVWTMLLGIVLGSLGAVPILEIDLGYGYSTLWALKQLAVIGLVAFVYAIGAAFDIEQIRSELRSQRLWLLVSGSLVVPAIAGGFFGSRVTSGPYVNAIIFATTAVPVLASIMRSLGILRSYREALAVAVVGDTMLWPALGVVVSGSIHLMALPAFGITMMTVCVVLGRLSRIQKVADKAAQTIWGSAVFCAAAAFVGASFTAATGLHLVAGAFLAGAITPKNVLARLGGSIDRVASVLIVPFFIIPGLMLGMAANATMLSLGLAYNICAGGSKIVGVTGAALLAGYSSRQSLTLAFLLNTRGTVELVVATTLLNAGLLSVTEFGAVVVMTVVCTGLTAPAVQLLERRASQPETIKVSNVE